MDHRRRTLWIGGVLVFIFWLLMSMPTNTHTFFYNHNIGNKVQEDLTTTSTYLEQIRSRQNVDSTYYTVHDDVQKKFTALTNEFNGIGQSGKKGSGEYVREILRSINEVLEKDEQNYRVSKTAAADAAEDIRKIGLMTDTIKVMVETGSIHEDIITQAEGVILSGYTCVKNNQRYVKFDNQKDKKLYTAENLETNTKRMLSVIDVWIDFFKGKYPVSFLFYVLLSILVDVAAFIFFDFAFKKREN